MSEEAPREAPALPPLAAPVTGPVRALVLARCILPRALYRVLAPRALSWTVGRRLRSRGRWLARVAIFRGRAIVEKQRATYLAAVAKAVAAEEAAEKEKAERAEKRKQRREEREREVYPFA